MTIPRLLAQDEQLLLREHEIEHLKLWIAKLQRMQFGRKSEKVQRQNRSRSGWTGIAGACIDLEVL